MTIRSRTDSEGVHRTEIALDSTKLTELSFKRCLEFLYTGYVDLKKDSEGLDDTIKAARLFNLPELQLIVENTQKEEEFLNPSIGTWLNDRNSSVAKQLFLNKVCMTNYSAIFVHHDVSSTLYEQWKNLIAFIKAINLIAIIKANNNYCCFDVVQPLFSDVSFSVEGTIIHSHKLVLCTRCDVLSAMLTGGFVESQSNEVNFAVCIPSLRKFYIIYHQDSISVLILLHYYAGLVLIPYDLIFKF